MEQGAVFDPLPALFYAHSRLIKAPIIVDG